MRLIDLDKVRIEIAVPRGRKIVQEVIDKLNDKLDEVPTVNAIPIDWIKKYEKTDDLAGSIYRMLEAWGADLSDYEDWEKVNK